MHIDIISVQPRLLDSPFAHSIMKRAQDKGLLSVETHDLKEFGIGKHRQVDDYQFGGGAGMVMKCEPLAACIDSLKAKRTYDEVIFVTPDGKTYDQGLANQLSLGENLLIICGHYKGIDERIREHYITMEISIGDYVLSGGELAAAVIVDSIGRIIPGVINNETSALTDSFQDDLLSPPVYTRPSDFNGWKVPEVLLSGHTAKIEEWRHEQALERTRARRPDLLEE
ncbi:tRNA (guanosine(37)-N1)-methyltransferase TrmD [Lewinellaceae bacterium SD302]|nr:tRNA (guanosine(37)-N1)-methyltransferase TrmD [Lewinellaceae bacterium SD302]